MQKAVAFPELVDFQKTSAEAEHYAPPADRIISGNPQQSAAVLFKSADGRFQSGVWDCEPGKWRVVFTENEFCHVLKGKIIVDGDDGSHAEYKAGEAFATPAGFTGVWEVPVPTKKYFAIYE